MAQNYVMMALGGFRFALETAAYQTMTRQTEYKWADQQRFGQMALQQFTGPGSETISMEGMILPHFKGGLGQVDLMRAQADAGVPLSLITGRGRYLGIYTVNSISETNHEFWPNGAPRRIDFSISLKRYDSNISIGNFMRAAAGLIAKFS